MTTCSSILAWEISLTEKPRGLQSMGLQRVRHDWVTKCTHTHHMPIHGIKWNHNEYSVNPKEYRIQFKREKITDGTTDNKKQDGRFKPNHIHNHLKYKWSKHPN